MNYIVDFYIPSEDRYVIEIFNEYVGKQISNHIKRYQGRYYRDVKYSDMHVCELENLVHSKEKYRISRKRTKKSTDFSLYMLEFRKYDINLTKYLIRYKIHDSHPSCIARRLKRLSKISNENIGELAVHLVQASLIPVSYWPKKYHQHACYVAITKKKYNLYHYMKLKYNVDLSITSFYPNQDQPIELLKILLKHNDLCIISRLKSERLPVIKSFIDQINIDINLDGNPKSFLRIKNKYILKLFKNIKYTDFYIDHVNTNYSTIKSFCKNIHF